MELTRLCEVIDLLEKSDDYLHQQEKLYILIAGKTYIIHNVNQQSYEYILKTSSLNPSRVSRKYTKSKGERWTLEEEEIMLKNPDIGVLETLLPQRTRGAIRNKLAKIREQNENKKPEGEV